MPTVLITGANRGIGLEFARQYAADGWKVHACCRNPGAAAELNALKGDIAVHALDVTDIAAIRALAAKIDEPLDVVIANAGVGGWDISGFGAMDYNAWKRLMDVNLYGAVATCEAFAPHAEKAKGKIVAMTSQMGSIADASGGAVPYRTSKAALNMGVQAIAPDLASRGVAVAMFHPGWVKTDMGGPNASITTEKSVRGLRQRIEEMRPTPSPRFLAYDGREIPW